VSEPPLTLAGIEGQSILLEMDNPRTQFLVPVSQIDRIHVVVGIIREGVYRPLVDDPFPASAPAALSPERRKMIEATIEARIEEAEGLIGLLDQVDGDPDLCGSEHDGGEPDACDEPSLGWSAAINQDRALKQFRNPASGVWGVDLEAEHDGREPCCEDEGAQCEDEGACETALAVL
jgi:hypothetical protein